MNITLADLEARLTAAEVPDLTLDALLIQAVHPVHGSVPAHWWGLKLQPTASVDAALLLMREALPGWNWRLASCSVSDDAWVTPDFNHLVHGARFRQEWPDECQRDPLAYLNTDVDLRPPERPAIALMIAMVRGMAACTRLKAEGET